MFSKSLLAATLALTLGTAVFAAQDTGSVEVTIKGVMQEDKGGMFIMADGQAYDLVFSDENSAEMKKFHAGLEGDMVRVKGQLVIEKTKDGKMVLTVQANDIARLRGERVPVVVSTPPVIQERVYVERERSGIHLPGVHINW